MKFQPPYRHHQLDGKMAEYALIINYLTLTLTLFANHIQTHDCTVIGKMRNAESKMRNPKMRKGLWNGG